MIAVDTNILVSAHRKDSDFHEPAAELVRAFAEGPHDWAIAWPSVHEFFAIVTHPRIYRPRTVFPTRSPQITRGGALPRQRITGDIIPVLWFPST